MKKEESMKEERKMKGWSRLAFVVLLAMSVAIPAVTMTLPAPALANQEMHPGGRLFYPLWDVSGSRLTFIIVTRLPLFLVDQPVNRDTNRITTYDTRNNCKPGHTTAHPAGPTTALPIFNTDDDVHFQWYGKNCKKTDEWIPMSCGDIDLIFLSGGPGGTLPAHYNASSDLQGALDVHFTINGNQPPDQRVEENSLLGHAVIVDPAGWAATYPAAAAKATLCNFCDNADGGTDVGYEPFPKEVFLPFALADDTQGGLTNLLSLWSPTFFPGQLIPGEFSVQWSWYDGRERRYGGSTGGHSVMQTLKSLSPQFQGSNFTCQTAATIDEAENDGFPLFDPACTNAFGADVIHTSDNLPGVTKQTSTSIGWWHFFRDSGIDGTFPGYFGLSPVRGLVGVVLTSTGGVGDATRLWHKDPCELGPYKSVAPPHLRDFAFSGGTGAGTNYLVFFNAFATADQERLCRGEGPEFDPTLPFPARFP